MWPLSGWAAWSPWLCSLCGARSKCSHSHDTRFCVGRIWKGRWQIFFHALWGRNWVFSPTLGIWRCFCSLKVVWFQTRKWEPPFYLCNFLTTEWTPRSAGIALSSPVWCPRTNSGDGFLPPGCSGITLVRERVWTPSWLAWEVFCSPAWIRQELHVGVLAAKICVPEFSCHSF